MALARIHAEGGVTAASETALQEASRIFGAGFRSLGQQVIKRRVRHATREFANGVKRLEAGMSILPGELSGSTTEERKSASKKAPSLTTRQEVRQTTQVRSWAKHELAELRAEIPVPKQSRRTANQALRAVTDPPSRDALRKRQERADARLPLEVQKRCGVLKELTRSEYKGGRTAYHSMPLDNSETGEEILNHTLEQHIPQPMSEDLICRAVTDSDILGHLKYQGDPSSMTEPSSSGGQNTAARRGLEGGIDELPAPTLEDMKQKMDAIWRGSQEK
jgi:hypothetical protein